MTGRHVGIATDAPRPDFPVFVITGQSGAGKGTLIGELLERVPEVESTVSATSRARRPGEEDGRQYWFLSDDEFERRVRAGEFLESVSYVGHRYGTLRSELDRIRTNGRAPLLELETEGALNVAERLPGAVTIFVTAPIRELERRLRLRATESSGEIDERLRVAREQFEVADRFDHVIHNDDLQRAVDELTGIVERELRRAATMAP
jgi:guanylate kinase